MTEWCRWNATKLEKFECMILTRRILHLSDNSQILVLSHSDYLVLSIFSPLFYFTQLNFIPSFTDSTFTLSLLFPRSRWAYKIELFIAHSENEKGKSFHLKSEKCAFAAIRLTIWINIITFPFTLSVLLENRVGASQSSSLLLTAFNPSILHLLAFVDSQMWKT